MNLTTMLATAAQTGLLAGRPPQTQGPRPPASSEQFNSVTGPQITSSGPLAPSLEFVADAGGGDDRNLRRLAGRNPFRLEGDNGDSLDKLKLKKQRLERRMLGYPGGDSFGVSWPPADASPTKP
jgi:hypothetical protein